MGQGTLDFKGFQCTHVQILARYIVKSGGNKWLSLWLGYCLIYSTTL